MRPGSVLISAGLFFVGSGIACADTYTSASFSGAINGGNANVKAPFSGNGFTQSDPFSGSLVFDNQLVPVSGSGFVNVPFSGFPDIGLISPATALTINFDILHFTLAGNISSLLPGGIQYNNGQFNGLEFITDFSFQGKEYQFRIDGPVITVKLLDGIATIFDPNGSPTGSSLINAHINVGNSNLTGQMPFEPNAVVVTPLPGALPLFATGLAALGLLGWGRRRKAGLCAQGEQD